MHCLHFYMPAPVLNRFSPWIDFLPSKTISSHESKSTDELSQGHQEMSPQWGHLFLTWTGQTKLQTTESAIHHLKYHGLGRVRTHRCARSVRAEMLTRVAAKLYRLGLHLRARHASLREHSHTNYRSLPTCGFTYALNDAMQRRDISLRMHLNQDRKLTFLPVRICPINRKDK